MNIFLRPIEVLQTLTESPKKQGLRAAIFSRILSLHSAPVSLFHTFRKGGKTFKNLSFYLVGYKKETYSFDKVKKSATKTAGYALAFFAAPLGLLFPKIPLSIYEAFSLFKQSEQSSYTENVQILEKVFGDEPLLRLPGLITDWHEPVDVDLLKVKLEVLRKYDLQEMPADLEKVASGQMHRDYYISKWTEVLPLLDSYPLDEAVENWERKQGLRLSETKLSARDQLLFKGYFGLNSVSVDESKVAALLQERARFGAPQRLLNLEAKVIALGKNPKHAKALYKMEQRTENRPDVKDLTDRINYKSSDIVAQSSLPHTDRKDATEALALEKGTVVDFILRAGLKAASGRSALRRVHQFEKITADLAPIEQTLTQFVEKATTDLLTRKEELFQQRPELIAYPFKQGLADPQETFRSGVCFAMSHRIERLQIENPDFGPYELAPHFRVLPQDRFLQAHYALEKTFDRKTPWHTDNLPLEKKSYSPIALSHDLSELPLDLENALTIRSGSIGLFSLSLKLGAGGHRISLRSDKARGLYFFSDPNAGISRAFASQDELVDNLQAFLKAYYPDLKQILWKELL